MKPKITKDFIFLTLATGEARDTLLAKGIVSNHEKIIISMTCDKEAWNPSEIRISTTIVANNLPQKESQTSIVRAIKKIFSRGNIIGVSFRLTPHTKWRTSTPDGATSNV